MLHACRPPYANPFHPTTPTIPPFPRLHPTTPPFPRRSTRPSPPAHPSSAGEVANLLCLPTWESAADEGVGVWLALVRELMALPVTPVGRGSGEGVA